MKQKGTGVGIVGMGMGLPETVRTNDWWPAEWQVSHDIMRPVEQAVRREAADVDPEVIRHARRYLSDPFRGTKERRVLQPDEWGSDLETAACRAALADAGIGPEDVDVLIGYSLIRDRVGIGNHGLVADRLGLRDTVEAFELSSGCTSFPRQIRVATRMIQAGEAEHIVIYAGTSLSKMTDYRQPSSVIPGDGAVAAVVSRVEEESGWIGQGHLTLGRYHDAILGVPEDAPEIPWYSTDQYQGRLLMARYDDAAAHYVGARAATLCRVTCGQLFEKTGFGPEDVDWFVTAQATAWFPLALCESLGLDPSLTLPPDAQFERLGHMMGASTPANLYLSHQLGRIAPGDLVLIYTPGVGFGTVATLLRWTLPPRS